MGRLVRLILLLAATACSGIPDTSYQAFTVHTMHDMGVKMSMPANFMGMSTEEEIDFWYNSDESEEFVERRITFLETMLTHGNATRYFVDTTNAQNDLRITQFPLTKISKYMSTQGFLVVDEMLSQQERLFGITYQVLENTFFTLANGNDVMQIRYKATRKAVRSAGFVSLADETEVFFTTLYFVTGQRTVSIVVNHESEDFEYFVRSLTFL